MRPFRIVVPILCLTFLNCTGEDETAERARRPSDPRPYLVHWEASRPDSIPVIDSIVFRDTVFFAVQDAKDRLSPDLLAAIDIRRDSLFSTTVEEELGLDASFGVVVLYVGPEDRADGYTGGGER